MYNPSTDQGSEIKINMSTNLKSDRDNDSTLGVPVIADKNDRPESYDDRHDSYGSPPQSPGPKKKSYREGPIRWVALFFACSFLLGSYFCYDNPGPIEKTMEKYLDISQT